jgi:hypothetical protein
MIDAEPCTCVICTWLDTPKDKRVLTETQVILEEIYQRRCGKAKDKL